MNEDIEELFLKKCQLQEKWLKIGDKRFVFFLPEDISPFINKEDPLQDFPLWARIWEGAIVLADYIYRYAPDTPSLFLEIGAGIGVVGITVASLGHKVVITDYNEDALRFAYVNALKNLGNRIKNVEIKKCDWRNPDLGQRFDFIIGSDVVYREDDYEHLMNLFKEYLKEDGEVILSEGIRKSSLKFLDILSKEYELEVRKKVIHTFSQQTPVLLIKAKKTKD